MRLQRGCKQMYAVRKPKRPSATLTFSDAGGELTHIQVSSTATADQTALQNKVPLTPEKGQGDSEQLRLTP